MTVLIRAFCFAQAPLNGSYGLLSVGSPMLMFVLLRYVSGVTINDAVQVRKPKSPRAAVSWPWVPAWGLLEPPRRDGENAQKTRKNGEEMGEIRPKTCKGVGITWPRLAGRHGRTQTLYVFLCRGPEEGGAAGQVRRRPVSIRAVPFPFFMPEPDRMRWSAQS